MEAPWRVLAAFWGAAVLAWVVLCLPRQGVRDDSPIAAASAAPPVRVAVAQPSNAPRPGLRVPSGPPRSYRGDARHTGRSPFRGPARPRLAWSYDAGAPITAQAVVDGRQRVYVTAHDGALHALTAEGELRFRRRLDPGESGARAFATPLLDARDRLYVGSDAQTFWAFDWRGRVRFRLEAPGPVDKGAVMAPGGTLLFAAGRQLYALGPDGDVRWRYAARGKIYTSPAVGFDGTVYVGAQDDHLHAVGPDGVRRWTHETGGDVDSSPVIGDDGSVYIGADDRRVHALTPEGKLLWARELSGYVRAPLSLGWSGELYAAVYGPRPALVALSSRDGHVLWSFPVTVADSTEVGSASGALVDVDGNLYFGAHDDHVYALTPGGRLRWAFPVRGDVDSSPALRADGTLIFGAEDGHLYGLRDDR